MFGVIVFLFGKNLCSFAHIYRPFNLSCNSSEIYATIVGRLNEAYKAIRTCFYLFKSNICSLNCSMYGNIIINKFIRYEGLSVNITLVFRSQYMYSNIHENRALNLKSHGKTTGYNLSNFRNV